MWSAAEENQELLVQGDTDTDILSADGTAAKMEETASKSSAVIHHLPSTYATIVDLLADNSVKDLLPSISQEMKTSWPLLMCDHMGKMCITLVPSEQSEPCMFPLDSPHSETLRAAATYRSSLYTCSDDGQLIQWQPPSSNTINKNQSKTNKKSSNKGPY